MKPEDLEPYERWQLEKYGDILPEIGIMDFFSEGRSEEEERFSEWMQYESEQQMLMLEENHSSIKD